MNSTDSLELLTSAHNIEMLMQCCAFTMLAMLFFVIVGALTRWRD